MLLFNTSNFEEDYPQRISPSLTAKIVRSTKLVYGKAYVKCDSNILKSL